MKLSSLKPEFGARVKRRRLGRGESSGAGKTCGRGGKGQKGRAGATIRAGFEGGQTPLIRRLPKLGFVSLKRLRGRNNFVSLNVESLERFEAGSVIGLEQLKQVGIKGKTSKVKLLAGGKLSKKIEVHVHSASAAAIKLVESVGGKVVILDQKSAS